MARGELTDDRSLRARGLFVAEGRFVVSRLLADLRWDVTDVFVTAAAEHALAEDLSRPSAGRRPQVHRLAAVELDEAGGFRFHQGCLAHARRRPPLPLVEWIDGAHRAPVVVLEAVRDPDNLGAIFRHALALGAGSIVVGPGCADPYYRKTIRTSMAAVLSVPFTQAADWPADLDRLRESGFEVVALTPHPEARALPDEAPRLSGRRVALLVGSEGAGLSAAALAAADRRVRVPMAAGVDSLNVATAVAVTLYALAHTHAP